MSERSCTACHQAILDPFLMQVGSEYWHETCLICHVCRTGLHKSCYKRDGKVLCKNDYERLYGIKCSICNQLVPPRELIMRVLGNIYHLRCFLCSLCGRALQKGDQFIIRNGQLICAMDFEREALTYQQCIAFSSALGLDECPAGDENMMLIAHAHSASDTARRGPKRPRTILTSHQRRAFKSSFEVSPKPCRKVRESLAKDLGLSVRVVQVWFQNQRAKIKKLQRRQQQTQQQPPKSNESKKNGTDDEISSDSSEDEAKSVPEDDNLVQSPSFNKTKKSTRKTSVSSKSRSQAAKTKANESAIFEAGNEEPFGSSAEFINGQPYSLDSMMSYSISPSSSVCDLSIENLSKDSADLVNTKAINLVRATQSNPIDDLYSMHSTYFDT